MQYNNHIFKYSFGKLGSGLYIVKGSSGQYMIDAGINTKKANKLLAEMHAEGIDFSQTKAILLTHSHQDHIRGIPFWRQQWGESRPVYVGAFGVPYVQHADWFEKELNAELGNFYTEVTKIPKKIGYIATDILWGKASDYDNVQALEHGQIFDLGDVKIKAIAAPGHNACHFVYEVTADDDPKRYILSGDLISFKDMQDGQGLVALASFNNPFSNVMDEIQSLKMILKNPPDVLMTAHYGIWEGKEVIQKHFENAIGEGLYLVNRAFEILQSKWAIPFREWTKEVINFPKYLSGIDTRTNSMYCILKEMEKQGMIVRSGDHGQIIALKPEKKAESSHNPIQVAHSQ
jgi:glyoxylase-like metal-dependent hydrolase (beta-lactamase superfamily II)